ncbi:uncharacterized protein LOC107605699 [Arachis ipaensis]|uniref:uncharacterized protein LOC107605699 n=1 Tax=Arachis ipaensis TaxID=130454 RepID=UPI0007AF26EA|nr:uncharacterized protein LOC107605699 [Arachis ipaensis]XP_025628124.1 uncharacterized protein LOC112721270 [Arachis hypogaea]
MGVQRPEREGDINASSRNIPPRQADNPSSVTLDNHSAPLKTHEYKAKLPYPQKLHKVEKDKLFARFLDILKTLEIKIPFAEVLEQIPSYPKFMKDILSHKRDWKEAEIVLLTKKCSAVIQRNLPEKLQDPGSFVIPCTIGGTCMKTILCDFTASINLMSLSLMKKLRIQEVKHTRICLQLADGSIKFPSGVVEDMIVRVRPFSFPTDFVILDMEEDKNASIILGRPFLATGRTIIDVQKAKVTLRVDKDEFVLNAVKAMQHPDPQEECMKIDVIELLIEEVREVEQLDNELDNILEDAMPELDAPEE